MELRLVVLNSSSTDDTIGLLSLARVCVNALLVWMSSWVGKSIDRDSYVHPCADLNSDDYTYAITIEGKLRRKAKHMIIHWSKDFIGNFLAR